MAFKAKLRLPALLGLLTLSSLGFLGGVVRETPDFGEKRKVAADRLVAARQALEEAQELQAEGIEGVGVWYRVVTEGEDGIGIRKAPRLDAPRLEDLVRGSVFEVDEVRTAEGDPIWLRLKDGRGWLFDLTPVDPDTPTVERVEGVYKGGKTLAELEADVQAARQNLDRIRGAKLNP